MKVTKSFSEEERNILLQRLIENISTKNYSSDTKFGCVISDLFGDQMKLPRVIIPSDVFTKMVFLVSQCSGEVGWNCTVRRSEDDDSINYLLDEVFIPPQTVTGSTVDTDYEEFEKWFMSIPADKINYLKMQCHSHVNMGVSPSGVDTKNQNDIVNTLKDNEFYIFMIMNKKLEKYCIIYDKISGIIFEDSDIDVCVVDELGTDLEVWAKKNIELSVKKKEYKASNSYSGSSGYSSYQANNAAVSANSYYQNSGSGYYSSGKQTGGKQTGDSKKQTSNSSAGLSYLYHQMDYDDLIDDFI